MRRLGGVLIVFVLLFGGGSVFGVGKAGATGRAASSFVFSQTIASGWLHTCAIVRKTLRCAGYNEHGELGNGTTSSTGSNPTPFTISTPQAVKAVAAGGEDTCVLYTQNFGVACWGFNGYGQLGTGDTNDLDAPPGSTVPVSDVTSVVVGSAHVCALISDGSVSCWGWNGDGQLGNDQASCDTNSPDYPDNCLSTTPVPVSGLGDVVQLAAGHDHTCALTSGGSVECWGDNGSGQLGNNEQGCQSNSQSPCFNPTPVQVHGLGSGVAAIAAGQADTCALTDAGGVRCWGDNEFGQLGIGTGGIGSFSATPATAFSKGAAEIGMGWDHTCAITTKDAVACWGRNQWGEIGDGTQHTRRRPVPVFGLGPDSGATEITGGYQSTCVRLEGDDIECWGRNQFGELGNGTTHGTDITPRGTLFGGPTATFVLNEKGDQKIPDTQKYRLTLMTGDGDVQLEDWPQLHTTMNLLGGEGAIHYQEWLLLPSTRKIREDDWRLRVVPTPPDSFIEHVGGGSLTLHVVVGKARADEVQSCDVGSKGTLRFGSARSSPDVIELTVPACNLDRTFTERHTGEDGFVAVTVDLEPRP